MACALSQKLSTEIGSKIQTFATASPTASCFYREPGNEHTRDILKAWRDRKESGNVFYCCAFSASCFEAKIERQMVDMYLEEAATELLLSLGLIEASQPER